MFDVASGNLLASRAFDFPLVLHDGLAYAPDYRESGDTYIRGYSAEFRQGN